MTEKPTRRGFLLGAGAAFVTASLSGRAFAQTAPTPDDVIVRLWFDSDQKLLRNGGLKWSLKTAQAQIQSSGIAGPSAADIQAEARADDALDRAALPIIEAWLTRTPAEQLPAGMVDKAFDKFVAQQAAKNKNIATTVTNLRQAGLDDAAMMFALAADLSQGGTLAGYDINYGQRGDLQNKCDAIVDHYTGMEASKIYGAMDMDIQIQRKGRFLETDFRKKVIDIPGWYIRTTADGRTGTEEVKRNVAYAYRRHAAETAVLNKVPSHVSDITYTLPGRYGNAGNFAKLVAVQKGLALNEISDARDVLLPVVAARIAALPPLPAPKPAPVVKAKPQPHKLRR